ncbi:MAG: CarD family transcriptional regulator [Lachnospiraceae bacterium]
MFKVGDYVMYKTEGVCRIDQITTMDNFPKDRQRKLYYVMSPLKDSGLKIYSAVDNTMIPRRPIMTEQEARNMVETMADIPELEIDNEKYREETYKKALKSCDCREWIRIVKTIYLRRQGRYAEGKKSTAIDDHYQKAAQELLLEELSVALHMSEEETDRYIKEHMQ